ncbi:MAG TPA: hypothetical protein VER68_04770, partial [Azonexus sp.]|nr:hypothetical protein [Azonexus sp.]
QLDDCQRAITHGPFIRQLGALNRLPILSIFIDTKVLREYVKSRGQQEKSSSGCVRFARLAVESLTRVEAGRYLVS